jgi:hypothetical protein
MTNEREIARRVIDDTGVSLDPTARKVLIEAVEQAFIELEQITIQFAAEHLRQAMNDVERQPASLATECNQHLIFDVRRLADELEAFAKQGSKMGGQCDRP